MQLLHMTLCMVDSHSKSIIISSSSDLSLYHNKVKLVIMLNDVYNERASEPLIQHDDRKIDKIYPKVLTPTEEVEKPQFNWILTHTIVNIITCFGVNFGLAFLSYRGQPSANLLDFPSPMLGGFFITIIVQSFVNWTSTGYLMTMEVLNGKIAPIAPFCLPFWPDDKNSDSIWWYDICDLAAPNLNPRIDITGHLGGGARGESDGGSGWVERSSSSHRGFCIRLFDTLMRSTWWMMYSTLIGGSIFTLLVFVLWGNDDYNKFLYQSEFMIAILGSFLSVLTVPVWGLLVLATMGARCNPDNVRSICP